MSGTSSSRWFATPPSRKRSEAAVPVGLWACGPAGDERERERESESQTRENAMRMMNVRPHICTFDTQSRGGAVALDLANLTTLQKVSIDRARPMFAWSDTRCAGCVSLCTDGLSSSFTDLRTFFSSALLALRCTSRSFAARALRACVKRRLEISRLCSLLDRTS